ncbi:MAG TPA: hypothetical protein VK172_01015 [Lentimicrobium sp.]|nr:hypothetical protein [Lentimicrobium sp.]
MKKIILLLALFVNLLVLKAQDSLYTNSNALIGFSGGVNFTKFQGLPFKDLSAGSQLTLGLFQIVKVTNGLSLKFNESFSPKKSMIMHPLAKIKGNYIDISVLPQARITDEVALQGGLVFNALTNDFKYSEFNVLAGAQVRLQKRMIFDVTYQLPIFNHAISNLNFSLNYIINRTRNKEPRPDRKEKQNLVSKLDELNKGILLVRLKNWDNKIDAYKVVGDTLKANQLAAQRRAMNIAIVNSFKERYHFSDVAFFFSDDSKMVKQGTFDGIFVNDSLIKDPSIKVNNSANWLIGEVDFLEMDTAKHWQNSHYNIYTKKYEKIYYSGSPNFGRCAIVIRDKNFIQLQRPFPYYVSCRTEIKEDKTVTPVNHFFKRSVSRAVKRLDKKLRKKYGNYFDKGPARY